MGLDWDKAIPTVIAAGVIGVVGLALRLFLKGIEREQRSLRELIERVNTDFRAAVAEIKADLRELYHELEKVDANQQGQIKGITERQNSQSEKVTQLFERSGAFGQELHGLRARGDVYQNPQLVSHLATQICTQIRSMWNNP